jgi:3-oxoacyl-[acyl-carrier protein] reductase
MIHRPTYNTETNTQNHQTAVISLLKNPLSVWESVADTIHNFTILRPVPKIENQNTQSHLYIGLFPLYANFIEMTMPIQNTMSNSSVLWVGVGVLENAAWMYALAELQKISDLYNHKLTFLLLDANQNTYKLENTNPYMAFWYSQLKHGIVEKQYHGWRLGVQSLDTAHSIVSFLHQYPIDYATGSLLLGDTFQTKPTLLPNPNRQKPKAIIFGASSSVGAHIGEQLLKQGFVVYLHYNNTPLDTLVVRLGMAYGQDCVHSFAANLSDPKSLQGALAFCQSLGSLHTVVYACGVTENSILPLSRADSWQGFYQTNTFGFFSVVQGLLRQFIKQNHGNFIVISSVAGIVGNKGQSLYSSSKAALHGFIKSQHQEWQTKNIQFNAIVPGFIDTKQGMAHNISIPTDQIPEGRLAKPEEIAHAVGLLSYESSISGNIWVLDGGLSCI